MFWVVSGNCRSDLKSVEGWSIFYLRQRFCSVTLCKMRCTRKRHCKFHYMSLLSEPNVTYNIWITFKFWGNYRTLWKCIIGTQKEKWCAEFFALLVKWQHIDIWETICRRSKFDFWKGLLIMHIVTDRLTVVFRPFQGGRDPWNSVTNQTFWGNNLGREKECRSRWVSWVDGTLENGSGTLETVLEIIFDQKWVGDLLQSFWQCLEEKKKGKKRERERERERERVALGKQYFEPTP